MNWIDQIKLSAFQTQEINPYQTGISEYLKRRAGGWAKWPAMFFPFKEHKPYQGTLGSLEVILIGSRIQPVPSMDPTGTLKWTS